jgi:hypothetical protein
MLRSTLPSLWRTSMLGILAIKGITSSSENPIRAQIFEFLRYEIVAPFSPAARSTHGARSVSTDKEADMKILAKIIVAVFLLAPLAVHADAPPPAPSESLLVEHGSYINKDGVRVHSPAHTQDGKQPVGASAQCRDKSYSFSRHHQGTCSHHGGVSRWLD